MEELNEACNFILSELAEHEDGILVKDLEDEMDAYGFSGYITRKAKQELKKAKKIEYRKMGMSTSWRVYSVNSTRL